MPLRQIRKIFFREVFQVHLLLYLVPPLFKRIAVININGKSVGKIVLNQSKSPSAAPVKTISGETRQLQEKRKTVRLPALRKPIFFNKFLLDEHFTIFTPFFQKQNHIVMLMMHTSFV